MTHWPPDLAEHILETMAVGFLAMDGEWRVTYLNAEAERLIQTDRAEALGAVLWDLFPQAAESVIGQAYRRVEASGQPESVETFYPAPLNRWYEARVVPQGDGVAAYFLDITERRGSQELLQLSVDVGARLVGSLNVDDAVAALARLVVPRLADWTVIALLEPDGSLRDVQTWHRDPAQHEVVERYAAVRLVDGGSGIVQEVVATARPIVIDSGVIEVGLARLPSETAKQALIATQSDSVAVVPLTADNHVAGVLSLYRGFDRPPMTRQELAVTLSMCRRAGMAIDNARLYAAQARAAEHDRTVAHALQQALLTELPNPAGLRLAARYFPAADDDQVGGDWYDAVCRPDGSTAVMIGDVVGHDIRAAASMGQLRSMLRMLAWSSDDGPAAILARLDEAVRGLNLHTLATVLMAWIAPAGPTGSRPVRWSTAGHLPPILLHADGSTEVLRIEQPDILIGFAPEERRDDHELALAPGATLLLYTDGLVERRDTDLDAGVAQLRASLSRHHHAVAGANFLDLVLADMVGGQPDDDIAVLAVRSDPQLHAES